MEGRAAVVWAMLSDDYDGSRQESTDAVAPAAHCIQRPGPKCQERMFAADVALSVGLARF